ncbi:xanthine dehydrogenase [Chromatiales bacterium (ex Bugula neritina AB1)]|nr:xanthine dehydrogenase [Chromatiales bacterium (ex Bugula neritina AB1)]
MNYARPQKLEYALDLLRDSDWTILAGGTDFYPALAGQAPSFPVLDITAIPDLRSVSETSDEVRIGALATWTDVITSPLPPAFKALQQAGVEVGSVQIQNRATVAGNVCNASPAADGVPPLLCLDAQVELLSHRGARRVPLEKYIQGNRRTQCAGDELVSAIVVPRPSITGTSAFRKLGARRYLVISIAMVAIRIEVASGRVESLSIAVGSCSEVAMRLPAAEKAIVGELASKGVEAKIEQQHLSALLPIDDIRSPASYRRHAALQLIRHTIASCIEDAEAPGVLHE